MEKHKLIITADDYGMSPAVNCAIEEGISAGLITATNVMTNMPCYQDAAKLRMMPVSVGIHWTLTCGKPVLPPEQVPTLTDLDGNFVSFAELRSRLKHGKISKEEVRRELTAQYQRFKDVVGPADYWNTHQNVHVNFGLFDVFVQTAFELQITRMRSRQRVYVPSSSENAMTLKQRGLEIVKFVLMNYWHKNARMKGMQMPNGYLCCLNRADEHDLKYLFAHIRWAKHEVAELVIHPANAVDSPYFGSMVENRMVEYRLFTDSAACDLLCSNGIRLTNYTLM